MSTLVVALGLAMHLSDQRAGRIQIEHVAGLGRRWNRFRDAVRGEYHRLGRFRDLVEFFDEHRALRAQRVNDELVVNDLVPHVDRPTVFLECQLNNLDRAVDTSAETARGR